MYSGAPCTKLSIYETFSSQKRTKCNLNIEANLIKRKKKTITKIAVLHIETCVTPLS